jgi:hypothetical protein
MKPLTHAKTLFEARPHPGPLPQGEGEMFAAAEVSVAYLIAIDFGDLLLPGQSPA